MGRSRRGLIGVLAVAAALLAAPHATAGAPPGPVRAIVDDAEDCLEAVPEQVSVSGVQDDGQEIFLDVHFLLDDVLVESAQEIAAHAAKPFREIGITLRPTFEQVAFPSSRKAGNGRPYIDSLELIQRTRAHVGGIRPHRADVVYAITAKEIGSAGAAGDAVAGQADCIGGVRYPWAAFAVGEMGDEDTADWHMWGGKVAGHEVAHLLGAHHHYANCAQGDPDTFTRQGTICTLMFNDVGLISLRFSTVEAAVVRGHALEYANETPTGPPPMASRTLDVARTRRGLEGWFDRDTAVGCADRVPVEVQRKTGRAWVAEDRLTTDEAGVFEVTLDTRGSFRVVAPAVERNDGRSWRTCGEAVSKTFRA